MASLNDIARKTGGVWLPKLDQHMLDYMLHSKGSWRKEGKITYQWKKQERGMELADQYMPHWREGVFVDLGAHCGFWSMWWGQQTAGVVAYEPIPDLRAIFEANLKENGIDWNDVSLAPAGVSDVEENVIMKFNPANTGASRILTDQKKTIFNNVETFTVTLDETLPAFLGDRPMTVMKIDTEGFEEKVVRGGLEVIKKHRPFIILEQRGGDRRVELDHKGGARYLLKKAGYTVVDSISGDHYMVPTEYMKGA